MFVYILSLPVTTHYHDDDDVVVGPSSSEQTIRVATCSRPTYTTPRDQPYFIMMIYFSHPVAVMRSCVGYLPPLLVVTLMNILTT